MLTISIKNSPNANNSNEKPSHTNNLLPYTNNMHKKPPHTNNLCEKPLCKQFL